jgi:hypothetical protein
MRAAKPLQQIAAVIDTMPERFTLLELCKAAGIKNTGGVGVRLVVAGLLARAFKCTPPASQLHKVKLWKRPMKKETEK